MYQVRTLNNVRLLLAEGMMQIFILGQTVLYIAAYMGSLKMVELLLKYRVKGKLLKSTATGAPPSTAALTEPNSQSTNKKRISDSIQALMSRLNVNLKQDASSTQQNVSPIEVDVYCDHDTQTALHIAVKNKHFGIASLLLNAGANPNLTIYLSEEEMSKIRNRTVLDDQYVFTKVFTGSTVLVAAVRHRDMGKTLSRISKRSHAAYIPTVFLFFLLQA